MIVVQASPYETSLSSHIATAQCDRSIQHMDVWGPFARGQRCGSLTFNLLFYEVADVQAPNFLPYLIEVV